MSSTNPIGYERRLLTIVVIVGLALLVSLVAIRFATIKLYGNTKLGDEEPSPDGSTIAKYVVNSSSAFWGGVSNAGSIEILSSTGMKIDEFQFTTSQAAIFGAGGGSIEWASDSRSVKFSVTISGYEVSTHCDIIYDTQSRKWTVIERDINHI
jgi:hypothetical protein